MALRGITMGALRCAAILGLVAVAPVRAHAAPEAHGTTMRPGRGRLLVASRALGDPNFARSVVLLLEYDARGAMGVVVNRPTRRTLDELRPAVDTSRTDTIYLGGPVLPSSLLVLMRAAKAPADGMRLFEGAHVLTSRRAVERALASTLSPSRLRFYAGHAGWAAGQLDAEIRRGDWHVMAAAMDLVFGDAAGDVWERSIERTEGVWTFRRPEVAYRTAPAASCRSVRRVAFAVALAHNARMTSASERLLETIRDGIIGADHTIDGPFGQRRLTYLDYTASGRSLAFIEDFIRDEVMPLYGNTHTETSGTGLQTTRFREDAREIIKASVGAGPEDVLIFCGTGATAAVDKMIDVLNLRLPADLDARYHLSERIPAAERPVVFIGPFEHHSNELPWRESIADVVVIGEDADGRVDRTQLREALEQYRERPLKIGSFSAASNVTGIGSDTRGISALLHRHGALAFWDFAAAGPYVRIEMNMRDDGEDGHLVYKDAIFLSPHKFVGGPGTPGVLVAKRRLFANRVPSVPGGGTVCYVSATGHRYLQDPQHREEGGTPGIIESIRAGLVFQLKEAVGAETIAARERELVDRAIACWDANPNIRILGNKRAWRLSIVSFMVRHGDGWLHHNFVVALLNDLLGIQARGGCSCAGPYGHRLLGIDALRSQAFEREILRGSEGIKPGWVRVGFNYFTSEATFDFVLRGVDLVAREGWKLLPYYGFDVATGEWRHRDRPAGGPMRLHDLRYRDGKLTYRSRHCTEPEWVLPTYLDEARRLLDAADRPAPLPPPPVSEDFEALRWFPWPHEVAAEAAATPRRSA